MNKIGTKLKKKTEVLLN